MSVMVDDSRQRAAPAGLRGPLAQLAGAGAQADGPALRADVLRLVKAALADGREAARTQLEQDGDGPACARSLCALIDSIIGSLFDFALDHVFAEGAPPAGRRPCLVAVGGYGRGLLAPGSDIDLNILLPGKATPWTTRLVEFLLYILWDAGLKVGHATRTVDEMIARARADMTIRTATLEARLVCGEPALLAELSRRFRAEVVAGTASEFIAAKLAERNERHQRSGNSRYLVEPHVKDGKGGLRDLHTLYWIGKYTYGVDHAEDLVGAGLFTRAEFERFRRAEGFLWTVRCHLHFLAGKAEERLSFDVQREIAERLRYHAHGGLSGVERFMRHYFLTAKDVGDLTLIVCAELEERNAKQVSGINGLFRAIRHRRRRIAGTLDFIEDNGRINVADAGTFRRDPVNMIRMFRLADVNGLDFHPDALHLLSNSLKLCDRTLRANEEANRLFLDVLTSRNDPSVLLRKMNESGLLGRFIPAFGKVVAMMQFNMYHHYTVDEHLIRSIGVLAGIESGRLAADHPLSRQIVPALRDREALYLALLLHDIAKGRGEDHSIAGARIARQLAPRFGLDEDRTELVAWLVREHLTMSNTAQGRDLSDPRTIRNFAEVVQTPERMRYLVVLTVCDIRAVGPGVWNGWKGQLLRTLFTETDLLLTGGHSPLQRKERAEAARARLEASLDGWDGEQRARLTHLPYPEWLLGNDLETQQRDMDLLREAERCGQVMATRARTRRFEAFTEITVLAPDHPRLLSMIAGACTAAGANIVDAKVHTLSDGRALDTITINREFEDEADELRRAGRIGKAIEALLSGKRRLPDVIASRPRRARSLRAFRVTPKVSIDNELSARFSVVEVEGLDRPGLLSELTGALSDLNLNIGSAHIVTFGEKVVDAFYVTDLVGQKITSAARLKRVHDTLLAVLDPSLPARDEPWRIAGRKAPAGG